MKQACGYDYTNKLQSMYADIAVSKNLTEKFRQTETANALEIVFAIKVLTHGCWPLNKEISVNLPFELTKVTELFTAFYYSQHSGRKLTWLYNVSKCEVIMHSLKHRYHIKVSDADFMAVLTVNLIRPIWWSRLFAGKYSPNGCSTSVQWANHIVRPAASWIYRYRSEIHDINVGSAHQIEAVEAMRARRVEWKIECWNQCSIQRVRIALITLPF